MADDAAILTQAFRDYLWDYQGVPAWMAECHALLEGLTRIASTYTAQQVHKVQGGALPPCDYCHQPQLERGELDLTLGIPDVNGRFIGTKRHRCLRCARRRADAPQPADA